MKPVFVLGYRGAANFLGPNYHAMQIDIDNYPTEEALIPQLLLFLGGEDISPQLYHERHPTIRFSPERDAWEVAWFHWAVKNKVPMFGICRGMQLFTALTGGKLIPHVNHHVGDHEVQLAPLLNDLAIPPEFAVNSLHHQMCIPKRNTYELLAYRGASASEKHFTGKLPSYLGNDFAYVGKTKAWVEFQPEALWFPEIRALGVQWHPEMSYASIKKADSLAFVREMTKKYLNV